MESTGLLLAAAAAAVLLLLGLRLRGPGGGRDLIGPPARAKRRFRLADGKRLHGLLAAGDRAGALRLLRELGHDEAESQRLLGLAERIEAMGGDGPPEGGALSTGERGCGFAYRSGFEGLVTPAEPEGRGDGGEAPSPEPGRN